MICLLLCKNVKEYSSKFTRIKLFSLLSRCWCLEVSNLQRKEAKVIYIDYGNCEWISWDRFTDIHKRFWDLAPQAVPFKLAGKLHVGCVLGIHTGSCINIKVQYKALHFKSL